MRPSSQFTCRRRGDETLTGPDRLLPKPSTTYTSRHIYDGNRVIQERTGGNIPLVSYTRGNDLSGSLEGLPRERSPLVPSIRLPGHKAGEHYSKVATVANLSRGKGGIGGLLARSDGYSTGTGSWSTNNYYFADGNGNITYLVNTAQSLAASYRYDPFGNLISSSGAYATNNVYRFSSKELHVDSGMYCYLYRFYDPNLQRWIGRDPFGEMSVDPEERPLGSLRLTIASRSEENLYSFCLNSPVDFSGGLGLISYDWQGFKEDWGLPADSEWGGLKFPFDFFCTSKPRNCTTEAVQCAARGVTVCTAFEAALPGPAQKGGYRASSAGYAAACAAQNQYCRDWNKDHGF
jgi:RHS repeat-associated protein